MANKFAYGTLVQGEYFTDRINELAKIKQFLNSENHLILISPRRYGKSSLVKKSVEELGRPYIWLDMQYAISTASFTTQLLKATLAQYPMERLKYELRRFRILPTATFNPAINLVFRPQKLRTIQCWKMSWRCCNASVHPKKN